MTENNQTCPCGSGRPFAECCEPVINGIRESETAEELLRARYSAFVKGAIDFIVASTHTSTRKDIDLAFVREWSETSKWHGLEILETKAVDLVLRGSVPGASVNGRANGRPNEEQRPE